MDIFEACPVLKSERFTLRPVQDADCADLFRVYSDLNALPFFNSDNCDGDNFYYATMEKMADVLSFWRMAYENRWFARLSIMDRENFCVIGTVELCLRVSEDAFNGMGIVRVDVRSDYEMEAVLFDIFSLLADHTEALLGCRGMLTKAPIYAVERTKAIQRVGYTKSAHCLIGKTGYAYDGYWTLG